jgi:hypothetical protein
VEADHESWGVLAADVPGVPGTGYWPDMHPSQFSLQVTVLLPPILAHSLAEGSNSQGSLRAATFLSASKPILL